MQLEKEEIQSFYTPSTLKYGEVVEFPSTRKIKQYTHRIYNRYPARSICTVPRSILQELKEQTNDFKELNVLDCFMGSGTTAVETALQGMKIYGVELDTFARLIAEVSTKTYNLTDLERLAQSYNKIIANWKDFEPDENYVPKLNNITYWFDEINFKELLQLKKAIYQICENKDDLDFLKITFADIIRPCSKMERQSTKPYISKKFIKIPHNIQNTFIKSFKIHFQALQEFSVFVDYKKNSINWLGNDATNFNANNFIDVAITSPPYANAFDYTHCIKIESSWVDCIDNELLPIIRNNQVGYQTRGKRPVSEIVMQKISSYFDLIFLQDKNKAKALAAYFEDMYANLSCVYKALKVGSCYHIIIGDNVVKNIKIPTHEIIAQLAQEVGFQWINLYEYKIKDHRTSIPRNGNGGKIEYEKVIVLKK
jgi:DNA modification methylase